MLLVVWTEKREDKVRDCWQYADTYEEASQQYDYYIKRDNTWAISICSVIKSTDYDLSGIRKLESSTKNKL